MGIKRFIQSIVPTGFVATKSIIAALREQKLLPLFNQLSTVVPDITHQYSTFTLDTEYFKTKVRGQHAFQINLVNEALQLVSGSKKKITIAKILILLVPVNCPTIPNSKGPTIPANLLLTL